MLQRSHKFWLAACAFLTSTMSQFGTIANKTFGNQFALVVIDFASYPIVFNCRTQSRSTGCITRNW